MTREHITEITWHTYTKTHHRVHKLLKVEQTIWQKTVLIGLHMWEWVSLGIPHIVVGDFSLREKMMQFMVFALHFNEQFLYSETLLSCNVGRLHLERDSSYVSEK